MTIELIDAVLRDDDDDDDYEVCIGCGSFAACNEEALCEDCDG